jgi:hypothetical protein
MLMAVTRDYRRTPQIPLGPRALVGAAVLIGCGLAYGVLGQWQGTPRAPRGPRSRAPETGGGGSGTDGAGAPTPHESTIMRLPRWVLRLFNVAHADDVPTADEMLRRDQEWYARLDRLDLIDAVRSRRDALQ